MSETSKRFLVETEVPLGLIRGLWTFLRQFYTHGYVLPPPWHFASIEEKVGGGFSLVLEEPLKGWQIVLEAVSEKPIQVTLAQNDPLIPQEVIDRIEEDFVIAIQIFEDEVRRTTLFFAWIEGAEPIAERTPTKRRGSLNRLFASNMLLINVIFLAASILLWPIFGSFAPMVMIVAQFLFLFYSDKVVTMFGDWKVTQDNPNVHILEYYLPREEYWGFQKRFGARLMKMKEEIYASTRATGKEITCESAQEVFSKYGISCTPESMSVKMVDLYGLLKKASESFGLLIPRVVVSNTMMPNAAAVGLSPNRGVVLITTGLFVRLKEQEVLTIIGHELSHLRARDSLTLFALITSEYLARVYYLWQLPVIGVFILFFPYLYLMFAMGAIYFIAKFLEARADLESAIEIGQPSILAEALRKIGYRRITFERVPSYRLRSWIGLDPHPPVSFRIERLEKLQTPIKVRHPLIQSIKDVIGGLRGSL